MCFRTLNTSLNGTLSLPHCTTDGTHVGPPRVLVFLAVGRKRAGRVSHTCHAALSAGFDLFLVHYDDAREEYRANFSWYERVAYSYEHLSLIHI